MKTPTRAIEVTGTVDEEGGLHLDEPLTMIEPGRVRVILLLSERDVDEREWLRGAATNPAFDFLKEPVEDIYAPNDGQPFDDQR